MKGAVERGQATALVLETDPRHGGQSQSELEADVGGCEGLPGSVREQVLGGNLTDTEGVIPWFRAAPYMAVSLKMLVQRLLYSAMPCCGETPPSASLYLQNELGLAKPAFPSLPSSMLHAFVVAGPSLSKVEAALAYHVPDLQFCARQGNHDLDLIAMQKCKVLVVFGEPGVLGDPGVDSLVRHASSCNMPSVVINSGVVFATLLDACPKPLRAYLFEVRTPLHHPPPIRSHPHPQPTLPVAEGTTSLTLALAPNLTLAHAPLTTLTLASDTLLPHPHPFPHPEAIAIEWHDNDGIQGGYNQVGAKLLAERLVSIISGKLAGGMSSSRACLSWMRGKHASRTGVLEEKAQEASADVSLTDGSSGTSASASAAAAVNANANANANASTLGSVATGETPVAVRQITEL